MRNPALACALVLCLCPLATYAEDKDVKKNTEVKVPDVKLKDGGFASPSGIFSVTGGTFTPSTGAFMPARDFAGASGTFRPSSDFQPASGAFNVTSGDFKPLGRFISSGFKLDGGTFSSSGFLSRK